MFVVIAIALIPTLVAAILWRQHSTRARTGSSLPTAAMLAELDADARARALPTRPVTY